MFPVAILLLSLSLVQAARLGNLASRQDTGVEGIGIVEVESRVWRHRTAKPTGTVAKVCKSPAKAIENPSPVEEPIPDDEVPTTTNLRKSASPTITKPIEEPVTPAAPIVNPPKNDTAAIVAASGDCSCGYVLSAHNNAYFPLHKTFDFSQITFNSALKASGWNIETGGIGGNYNGNQCIGSEENIKYANGVMSLIVPAGKFSGVEMAFKDAVTGGMFTIDAQIDSTVGTCQSIIYGKQHGDEQDIEILGADLATNGIELTNWDPASPMAAENRKNSFAGPNMPGADLSSAFHTYTIGWLPGGTKYLFDGTPLKSPSGLASVNPSMVRINHWTNGAPGFTKGPPAKDTVFKIRKIEMYYTTGAGLPSGCTEAKACKV